jgi:hypothetical protein
MRVKILSAFILLSFLAAPLASAELKVVAPEGLKVSYAILTAPFSFSDQESQTLTAIVLNYDSDAEWSMNVRPDNTFAVIAKGKKIPASHFVFAGGFHVRQNDAGGLDLKQVAVERSDQSGPERLFAVGIGDLQITARAGGLTAWFLFAISDGQEIGSAALANVKLVRGKKSATPWPHFGRREISDLKQESGPV